MNFACRASGSFASFQVVSATSRPFKPSFRLLQFLLRILGLRPRPGSVDRCEVVGHFAFAETRPSFSRRSGGTRQPASSWPRSARRESRIAVISRYRLSFFLVPVDVSSANPISHSSAIQWTYVSSGFGPFPRVAPEQLPLGRLVRPLLSADQVIAEPVQKRGQPRHRIPVQRREQPERVPCPGSPLPWPAAIASSAPASPALPAHRRRSARPTAANDFGESLSTRR